MSRHFDPLRPNRALYSEERYEFTHGDKSVCVYDISTLDFVKEIPIGPRPDCHSTSADNKYLYMACEDGLYCIDQDSLSVVKFIDTGHVFATNVMPDAETMLLHDAFGGFFVIKNIQNMEKIHIHKRVDAHRTNTAMDTLGGKGHFIGGGRYYLCCGWEHPCIYSIDLQDDYAVEAFIEHDPALHRCDDLVVSADKTKAYAACYCDRTACHVCVISIAERRVIKTIPTGSGTCGLTMSNDERYVIASNDGDDAISVIDTQTDEISATLSARPGFEKLGIDGYIQGISIGRDGGVFVYGCSGNGALVKFTGIPNQPGWVISFSGGKLAASCR